MREALTPIARNVLATVALSHQDGCMCEVACGPLHADSARKGFQEGTHMEINPPGGDEPQTPPPAPPVEGEEEEKE